MFPKILKNKNQVTVFLLLLGIFFLLPQISLAAGEEYLAIRELLWTMVNMIFGWLVWAGGLVLNYSIDNFVVGFGFYFKESGIGEAINVLWGKVRDIFNLTFIFGLVYIGFKMILNSDDSNAKRMLGSLIIAALLVNFSLFITKAVIDSSNIAAATFAQPFLNQNPDRPDSYAVSDSFMGLFNINSAWDSLTGAGFRSSETGATRSFSYIFGIMYLYIAAGFVFFAGGILLIIRFVVLNIYMLLSPILFLGMVFPNMAGVSKEYWNSFLKRAFFAPAYLLMIYFSYNIVSTLNNLLNKGGRPNIDGTLVVGGSKGPDMDTFAGTIMFFIIAIAFLVASLVVAQKMGAQGADMAVSLGKKASNKIRGGVTSLVGRQTLGRLAGGAEWTNNKLERTVAGRMLKRSLSLASLGALDERGRRAAIDKVKKSKFGGSYSRQDDEDWKDKRREGIYDLQQEHADSKKIKDGQAGEAALAALRAKQKAGGVLSAAETIELLNLEKAEAAMLSVISSMTTKQLENLSAADLERFAPHLTNTQVENIMKSDKIDPAAKAKVGKTRQTAIRNMISASGKVLTKELAKLSIDQIETMGDDWIRDNVHLFSNAQVEDLKKSKKFTESQKNSYATQRSGWHKAAMTAGGPAMFNGKATDPDQLFNHTNHGGSRKAEDVANLGRDILVSAMTPAFLNSNPTFLTKDALEIISTKKTLGTKDREDLEASIMDAYTMPGGNVALKPLVDFLNSPRVLKNGGF